MASIIGTRMGGTTRTIHTIGTTARTRYTIESIRIDSIVDHCRAVGTAITGASERRPGLACR
jgi:hypothetical protein